MLNLPAALLWELADMPHMPLSDAYRLPARPGVYLVYRREEVLYVGKSVNLQQRWIRHHRQRQFAALGLDVELAYLPLAGSKPSTLAAYEHCLISTFQPPLNGKSFPAYSPLPQQIGHLIQTPHDAQGLSSSREGSMPASLHHPSGIGQRIRALRKQRGLNLKDLADKLGVSMQMVSFYERGECNIPSSRIVDIARVLGVTPGYLYKVGKEEEARA